MNVDARTLIDTTAQRERCRRQREIFTSRNIATPNFC